MNKLHSTQMKSSLPQLLLHYFFILSLIVCWQTSYAQGASLFEYYAGDDQADLSESEIVSPAAIATDIVQVNAAVLIAAENFAIELPDGRVYEATATSVEQRGENSWSWSGLLVADDDVQGVATLSVVDGVTSGLINLPHATYELSPLNGTQSLLQEIDSSLYPEEHPDDAHDEALDGEDADHDHDADKSVDQPDAGDMPEEALPPADHSALDSLLPLSKLTTSSLTTLNTSIIGSINQLTLVGPTIDVLVVYTETAKNAAGGTANIKSIIQNAVDITNTAYANSQVSQRIKLVHSAEVNYVEVNSLYDALDWVKDDAAVAQLRNDYGADQVALITEQGGGFCGLAKVMRTVSASFEDRAFSVTKRSCAVGNLSFAHELGHNQGLEHDPANGTSPANASYPYAFGHFVDGQFRTVMSYSNQCTFGCTRVPYFSNPDVSYLGYATGIANQRDNARVLDNTDSIVAAFRLGLPAKPVLISPSGDIADNTPSYTWNAVPTATWYQLYVNDSTGNVINQVISASDLGCAAGTGTCSITHATVLAEGNATWWVNAWNGHWGGWSAAKNFKVIGKPAKATLISPANIFTLDTTPTYKWNAVPTATWYQLWVNDSTGNKINKWYTAAQAGCSAGTGTCTITPTTALAAGKVTWWIKAYNGQYGPWSNSSQFSVIKLTLPLPFATSLIQK